mmetsp:Transcript_25866/g.40712  ORF Transcript_25866/g.40712 Transcript_25866/m.40712 type:complete len:221 (-) Transcript_25866:83-745(-)
MILGQLSPQLIGQLARHPIVLNDVRCGVLLERPLLELRLVARLPVRNANVVKHGDGALDRVSEYRKQPPLGRGREEVVRLEHVGRHHQLGQVGVGEPHRFGARYPRDGGAVDVDEGTAVRVGDPRDSGVDDGNLGISAVPVGDAEFGSLDEAMASSHGVLDGGAACFGNVPKHGNISLLIWIPCILKITQKSQHAPRHRRRHPWWCRWWYERHRRLHIGH